MPVQPTTILRCNRVCIVTIVALGAVSCGNAPDPSAVLEGSDTALANTVETVASAVEVVETHPDLTGVWYPGAGADPDNFGLTAADYRTFDPTVTPQEAPSFQPWAEEKIRQMGDDLRPLTPGTQCMPRGPASWGLGQANPIQIVQTPDQIVLLTEMQATWRIIHMDGRPQEVNPEPQYHGYSVGRWEGDTLVVDVVGVDPNIWIGGGAGTPRGWFVSDELHLTERWSRPDPNTLNYQVTIEDPKVLTRPWTSAVRSFTHAPGKRLYEYFCTNNVDLLELLPSSDSIPRTPEGSDARFWDPQEYERLRQQFP